VAIKTSPGGGKHRKVSPTPSRKPTGPQSERSFFRRYWWAFVAAPFVVIAGIVATFFIVYALIDVPDAPPGQQTTFVFDRSGRPIARFHAAVDRTDIPFQDMPKSLRNAVIAVEDKGYYRHGGISLLGIFRAAWANVTSGEIEQGGSTITQQYVKNVYTGSERTFTRKFKEAILAVKVDHKYSKDEVLHRYLNTVYFGQGAYGAQAAARTYFGVDAEDLSASQSALLAGVIPSPGRYDPYDRPDQAKGRRDLVLDLMAEQGYVERAEAERLKAEPVEVKRRRPQTTGRYPYFIDYIRRQMLDQFGEELTFSGGLRVRTTLDQATQKAAEAAIAEHLPSPDDPSAAVVAIDPSNGAIRALVGGKDFDKDKFNAAFQANRGAGSAFKPFTLTAALEERISPKSIWHGPSEITIPDKRCYTDGKPWKVHNYADQSAGTMSLIDATARSVNTIFAQLVVDVGPEAVGEVAQRMGIQSDLEDVCSITLGTQGVTPMEMTAAYATLAARGTRHTPIPWSRVRDNNGADLDKPSTEGEVALDQNDADMATYILQQVVTRGTGTAASIGRPVAGKTGTDQDYKNAWFCGYTPQLAGCVWLGYAKSEKPMENVQGVAGVTGGSIPAAIWRDFMSVAMERLPVENFATPDFGPYDKNPTGIPTVTPSPSPKPSPKPTQTGIVPIPTVTLPGPSPSPSPSPSPTESPGASANPNPDPSANGPP
jgi:penicillin-binding protein 1A